MYRFTDITLLQEFAENSDITTPVTNTLPTPIVARYLRLYPMDHQGYRSLRFDVIGCEGNGNLNMIWYKCLLLVLL